MSFFDEIDHTALLRRVRGRVGDKRVLALVKAFLKSGILAEDGALRASETGTPQGGILSPLLANIALSVLDEHFVGAWEQAMGSHYARAKRRRHDLANYRLVRYADDFVVLVAGTRADAERLREQAAAALAPVGLRLSPEKTIITHIDEGFDFLGMRIRRHKKRGSPKRFVYTYPSRASLASVKAKVRSLTSRRTTNSSLDVLIHQLNPLLRGWTSYHRHGASAKTFSYLCVFTWRRIWNWLRAKHPKASVRSLQRRYYKTWWPQQDGVTLLNPDTVAVTRYRYRGAAIPTPWATTTGPTGNARRETMESRMR